jgi:hypothetical protein
MAFSRDPDKPRRSWARRALITFNVVLATVLVLGASLVGYSKWRFGDVRKLDLGITGRGSGEPSNVLLVGSDTREELGPELPYLWGQGEAVP